MFFQILEFEGEGTCTVYRPTAQVPLEGKDGLIALPSNNNNTVANATESRFGQPAPYGLPNNKDNLGNLHLIRSSKLQDMHPASLGLESGDPVGDSGAAFHMIGLESLSPDERDTIYSGKPVSLCTANGLVSEHRRVDLFVQQLDITLTFLVLDKTPKAISLGRLLADQEWNLWWRGSSDPIIFDQAHVKVCELKLHKFVPFFQDRAPDDGSKFYDAFLTEGCIEEESFSPHLDSVASLPAPQDEGDQGSIPRPSTGPENVSDSVSVFVEPDPNAGEDLAREGSQELVPEPPGLETNRSATRVVVREPPSIKRGTLRHLMLHEDKCHGCPVCDGFRIRQIRDVELMPLLLRSLSLVGVRGLVETTL